MILAVNVNGGVIGQRIIRLYRTVGIGDTNQSRHGMGLNG